MAAVVEYDGLEVDPSEVGPLGERLEDGAWSERRQNPRSGRPSEHVSLPNVDRQRVKTRRPFKRTRVAKPVYRWVWHGGKETTTPAARR